MPARVPAPNLANADGDEARVADAEPALGLCVNVVHEAGDWGSLPAATETIGAAAAALAAELSLAPSEACVALSCDAEVARLNAHYRGKPAPTNVLSFPAGAGAHPETAHARFLGDVVLAAETVTREAAALGLPLAHHLQHLVVHGLLHLLGHDHATDEEAEAMEAIEVRVLARLGIADPYAGDEPAHQRHAEFSKT